MIESWKEIWKDEGTTRRILATKKETPAGLKFKMKGESAGQKLAEGLYKRSSVDAMRSLITELNGSSRSLSLTSAMPRLLVMQGVIDIVRDSIKRKAVEEALGG